MKKFTMIIAFMLVFAGMATSQMIADFEHIPLNLMKGGEDDNSSFRVVPNPDKGDANPSNYVAKFTRSKDGLPWGGFFSALADPIDLTTNKYIHVQVWKTRISPIKFKIEGGTTANFEIPSVNPQTKTEEWETMVFHFDQATGTYSTVVFMPDFIEPIGLDDNIVIYFDNIVVSNSADPASTPVRVIEDFETIEMNLMAAGDNGHLHIIPNPDQGEGNESAHVVEFKRGVGDPWAGFFSALPEPLDLSTHKYVYVDVWKPRISPVKFKLEGGPVANTEVASMFPQTKTEEWETLVFDFSALDGQWNVITFMPDFEEPLTLTDDIMIYFDNIRLGDAPENGGDIADIDFMWCDFTDQYTNVGGFREAIGNTVVTDLTDGGIDGTPAVKVEYNVSDENQNNGYRMWAFPDKHDVTSYKFFAVNIKAEEPVQDALVLLRDDTSINGRSTHTFNIGTEWQQILIPLDDFVVQAGFDNKADLTILHLIQIEFNHGLVSPGAGTVYIDAVGFITDAVSVDELVSRTLDVNVFPNPARNFFHVSTERGAQVSLFGLSGNLIETRIATQGDTRFDIEGLSQGIYLVRVVDKGMSVTRKIVVQ